MKKIALFMIFSLGLLAAESIDRTKYFGKPIYDEAKKLKIVEENDSQTHSKDNFVLIRVKGIKTKADDQLGRVRVAVWDKEENYGKEGVAPFRASSHWGKDAVNGEMVFKIGGLTPNQEYSFFAHVDEKNKGKVRRIFGIPTEPYIFSNAQNQGKGPGLTREGLSAPKFKSTLVKFLAAGQEVVLNF